MKVDFYSCPLNLLNEPCNGCDYFAECELFPYPDLTISDWLRISLKSLEYGS